MTKSVLLVGVGGQGTILASKLLTTGLMQAGYDVKMSEIHGMSQRGGSVSSQVRYGEKVLSPVIEPGGADILVSFEVMEALRWLNYLKPDGKIIVNQFQLPPMPVITGEAVYATDIIQELQAHADVTVVDAAAIASRLGNPKAMNIVLLGAIIKAMNLTDIDWEQLIRETVKPAFVELNIQAVRQGMAAV
ncbi:MAG: indolepyruvate oxidoreductase subunit beta [Firmicutes bacterium]|nr:indolepyruvate oxidoreductase subunit beta [Bacillota bacterium]